MYSEEIFIINNKTPFCDLIESRRRRRDPARPPLAGHGRNHVEPARLLHLIADDGLLPQALHLRDHAGAVHHLLRGDLEQPQRAEDAKSAMMVLGSKDSKNEIPCSSTASATC